MTTQTQSTINLQTLTDFITSHLAADTAINVAMNKLETYGYIVFQFSNPKHGFRNIKFIPDSNYWYVKVSPIYCTHHSDQESETIDLYNVWEWLAWRIPSIFPQVKQVTETCNRAGSMIQRAEKVEQKTTEQILQDLADFRNKPLDQATLNGWNILCDLVDDRQAQPLTVTNRSLREQTLDASVKVLQHSLGNMMFRAEGLHPISDTTIHIQLDGGTGELDINFWPLLDAFRNGDPARINGDLCDALKRHGKINGKSISKIDLIDGVFCFTL